MSVRTFSIDVTKLDRERIKTVTRRDGTTAKFVDLVIMDRQDDYGNDGFVCQQCTKEERDRGLKMPILGNAKSMGGQRNEEYRQQQPARQQSPHPQSTENDDIPF